MVSLTVNNSYQVEVSRRIRAEFKNGRDFYALRDAPPLNSVTDGLKTRRSAACRRFYDVI